MDGDKALGGWAGREAAWAGKVEHRVELMEDPVVRAALAGTLKGILACDSAIRRVNLLMRVSSIADSLPASIGPDETAAALRNHAQRYKPEKGEHHTPRALAVKAAVLILDELSSRCLSTKDPYITWIRENDAALGEHGRLRRINVKRLLLSPLGPASCRMVRTADPAASMMVVFDTDSRPIQDLIISAACSSTNSQRAECALGYVGSTFAESLGGDVPATLEAFGEGHLAKQMAFYDGHHAGPWLLRRIYTLISRAQGPAGLLARGGITAEFLACLQFLPHYRNGFRAVKYSPLDPPPTWDKWYVFPNGTEDDFAAGKPDKGSVIDFTEIDPSLRDLAKKWYWEDDACLQTKYAWIEILAGFSSWRQGAPGVVGFDSRYLILSEELGLYLSSLRPKMAKKTFSAVKCCMQSLVEFLLEEGDGLVDPQCVYAIREAGEGSGGKEREKLVMPADHYRKIEKALEERSGDSPEDLLVYTAFLLLGTTPLRISSVLDLKRSQIAETSRKGLHAVRQPSKTTGRDARGVQLPPKTKGAVDRAVRETQGLRDAAPEEMRDYVFLVPGHMGRATVLPKGSFVTRFGRLCRELELPAYSPESVRSGYMTAVDKAADELGMGQAAKNAGSDHVEPRTSPEHYIQHSDREYYEAMHGVEIGTAKIRGRLSAEAPECASESSAVEHGAGWCVCESCLKAIASCLICPSFCTCPSQIPAFKANIERADALMPELETDHDRGHLAAFKSLNVAYLCALEGMKREMEGSTS
ncbi:MAG: hypothetical protein ACI36Y_08625 [Coriobacteriales bacterium]